MRHGSHSPDEQRRRGDWLAAAGLALLVIALYARTMSYEYVRIDDWPYVLENPHVTGGLSWETVRWAFTTSYASNYHPLTWLSHALDSELFGTKPGPAHAVNMLLHAANSVLLFLAFRRLTTALWASLFVATAFAIHPLRVESVAWIAERKDLLAGFFWMIALLGYERYARTSGRGSYNGSPPGRIQPSSARSRKGHHSSLASRSLSATRSGYALVVVAMGLGLLCKPVLVTLPFALLLLDKWPLDRYRTMGARALILEKLPLALLAAASAIVTVLVQRSAGSISSLDTIPLHIRAINAVASYYEYVRLSIWPLGLACFYPHPFGVDVDPLPRLAVPAILGGVLVLLVTIVGLRLRSRAPYVLIGWAWYLGVLVPMIGLVQVGGQAYADRYTYLPSIGLFLVVAFGAAAWAGDRSFRKKATMIAGTIVLVAFAGITWKQVAVWKDSVTLLEHAISVTEKNYLAHNNLGQEYTSLGRFDDAIAQFEAALAAKPSLSLAHYNIGYVHLRRQDLEQAAASFEEAIRIDPTNGEALNNLGRIFDLSGDQRQATALYKRALASPSPPPLAAKNLGWVLATSSDPSLRDGASAVRWAEYFANAVGRDRADALETLAAARAQVGDFTNAVALQASAIERAPEAQRARMRVHLEQYRRQIPYEE